MTSTLGIKKIQYPNGTDILTLDSSGSLAIADSATVGGTLDITGNVGLGGANTSSYLQGVVGGKTATIGDASQASSTLVLKDDDGVFDIATTGGTFRIYDDNNERLRINSNGSITISQQLTCLLYKNGNQSVSQNSGFQVTGWAAVNDPASMYDNSNARITVPTAGQYIIGGHIQCNQIGGVHFSILKNGAAIGVDSYLNMGDTLGSGYSICINCSANDYFTVGGYVTTAATVVSANRSKWWIQKVA